MERGYQQLSYAIRHDSALTLFRMEIDNYGAVYRSAESRFCRVHHPDRGENSGDIDP